MQYLVIFTPKRKFESAGMPSDFAQVELGEQAQVHALYKQGGLRQVWALDIKNKGAAILFEAESREHLDEMIGAFPLVKADYTDHQVWPLAPWAGFAKGA